MSQIQNTDGTSYPWRIDEWFLDLDLTTRQKLKSFCDLLIANSKSVGLISLKTIPFVDAVHFADCILASRIINEDISNMPEVYDFGSGAGFPGIVFSILYPSVKIVLVEADIKKIDFLNKAILTLGLSNVRTLNKTVESLDAESVKYAISRELSNLSKSILSARKCFIKGGVYFHLKSEQWGMEFSEIPIQLCSIWSPALVKEYKIPTAPVKHAVVKTVKL